MIEKLLRYLNTPFFNTKNKLENTVLFFIYSVVAREFEFLKEDMSKLFENAAIISASGSFLDFWGFYLCKIRRLEWEDDASYRKRILLMLRVFRSTRNALFQVGKKFSRTDIEINEESMVIIDEDYSVYELQDFFERYIIEAKYQPERGLHLQYFYLRSTPGEGTPYYTDGYPYFSEDERLTYLDSPQAIIQNVKRIEGFLKTIKLAGVRLISNIRGE